MVEHLNRLTTERAYRRPVRQRAIWRRSSGRPRSAGPVTRFSLEPPDAWYSRLASVPPITAPFAMPVAVGEVAAWEILLATAIILAATYGLVRLGGAVYSGSLLRTGARPRLRDVWSAARTR